MKRIVFAAATALLLGAAPMWATDEPTAQDADNTGRNVRDRDETSGTKPTPMDQSNAEADVKLTADIRRAITEDDSMSTNARNVKIITNAGNVVLRGPVDSAEERDKVAATAKKIAGVKRVDNQLEINRQ
jgi:osmotically-inducible protein OsmY